MAELKSPIGVSVYIQTISQLKDNNNWATDDAAVTQVNRYFDVKELAEL